MWLEGQGVPLSTMTSTLQDEKTKIANEIQNLLKTAEAVIDDDDQQIVHPKSVTELLPRSLRSHTPVPGISQLLPTLYLCGAGVAVPSILERLQVRFVVNVAPELPDTPLPSTNRPLYLRVNVIDKADAVLDGHFDEVADMIEEVRQHGGRTLVHCVAGVSRSATLCIAYLLRHEAMSLRDAYHHVKAIRPQVRPNIGFFQQLHRYELRLRNLSTVQFVYFESLGREIPDVYEPEYRAMEEFYQRHRKTR